MAIPEELKTYAARLGFPESETLGEILSILFPDDLSQKIAAALPGTIDEVAGRTNIPVAVAREVITRLCSHGAINHVIRKGTYRLFPAMIELRDAIVIGGNYPPGVMELWEKLIRQEMPALITLIRELNIPPMLRAVPIEEEVQKEGRVLDIDSARSIFRDAQLITAVPCPCRTQARAVGRGEKCPAPPTAVCMQTNGFAEAIIDRGIGERLSTPEALKRIGDAEDAGLMHFVRNNIKEDMFMCNCCACCCTGLFLINELSYLQAYAPSRFQIAYDESKCTGCGLCVDRCQVRAISLDGVADIYVERCFGCGNCAHICPAGALTLVEVRPREFIRKT